MINYVFYFNSEGLIYSPTVDSFIGRKKDGYVAGDELTVAYEGRFDEKKPVIAGTLNYDTSLSEINEETGKRIAEKLFQKFNAPWECPNEYAGPSMSIGDVVTLFFGNGAILSYACESIGFRKIEIPLDQFISKNRPANWTRNPAQIKEYLTAKATARGSDQSIFLTEEEEEIAYEWTRLFCMGETKKLMIKEICIPKNDNETVIEVLSGPRWNANYPRWDWTYLA
jgi:hypothetical protein